MTHTDENRSDDDLSQRTDSTAEVELDRRSYLQLAGVSAATLSSLAGRDRAESNSAVGPQGSAVGYGGIPAISELLSVPDPEEVPDEAVTRLGTDGQTQSFPVPETADLFAFDALAATDLTVTFDGRDAVGGAVLGLFDPSGSVVEQVYMNADQPVYVPERTSAHGTHYLQVASVAGGGGTYGLSVSTNRSTSSQSPYEGTARSVPGRVQAENFDIGGEGVAYHDTSEQNQYDTSYRDGAVDIRETQDESGSYNVGYFEDGEWLEYTIDPTPGTYDIHVRVASERTDRRLEVSLDGESLGAVDIPNTGEWTNWETVTLEDITVTSDEPQVLRLTAEQSGIDFNWFEFEAVELKGPYEGTPWSVPGKVQAEDFDNGGEGIAYHETTEQNQYDTSYRDGAVDIRETQDESGSYNVGYFEDGEWLEYTVDPNAGTYDLRLRVASARSGRQLNVTLDGDQLATVDVPNTGGWSSWETVTVEGLSIETDAESELRFEAVGSGIDFNWFEFERVEVQGPFGGTVATIPGRIQAENFDTGGEGVAYHDTSEGNEYNLSYRDMSVDIRETQDVSGAYNIGYFQDGEWLEYTVSPTPDTYDIHLRVATPRSGRQVAISLDDRSLGTVDIPDTGEWTNWETVTLTDVEVSTDTESVLRLEALGSGIDLNWVEFVPATTQTPTPTPTPTETETPTPTPTPTETETPTPTPTPTETETPTPTPTPTETSPSQTPYGDSPAPVPGRVEAEDFDVGGEGVAYSDTTDGNEYDTSYRNTSVDIRETDDVGGRYNIGYFEDGEWLEYAIAPASGTYDLRVRLASARSDRQLNVTLDGEQLATVDVPNTGGWSNWETVRIRNLELAETSESVLRFEAVGSGIDFNWFEFVESTESDYGELGYGEAEYGGNTN